MYLCPEGHKVGVVTELCTFVLQGSKVGVVTEFGTFVLRGVKSR